MELADLKTGEIFEWEDIKKSGLDKELFIKYRNDGHISLLSSIVFYEKTYFPNITFYHFNGTSKFKVEETAHSAKKANHLTQIRNLEWEIERLENTIWAYKFELDNPAAVPALETELTELKKQLLELIKTKI